jgi:hypothetical protein
MGCQHLGGLVTVVALTSLNAPLAGTRRLAWVRARLDEVRVAGRGAEASVNDVVLTAVAGGLRSLFLERGERPPPDLVLKALVPVSLHGADEHGTLGNRVSTIYAPLPVGIGDPQARLAAVARSMRRLKSRSEADSMGLVLDAATVLPAGVARMLEAFPVVPLAANMTVGVAVVSYDGALTISLTADDLLCSDADVFAAGSSDRWHSSAWPRRSPAVDRRSDAFDCTRSALTDARRYRPCTATYRANRL